jgi:uncharacterized MAPEG superfamily protein
MTIELWMLFWAVVLAFAQMAVAVGGATRRFGVVTLAGNREGLETLSGWKGRAERAYRNALEFCLTLQPWFLSGTSPTYRAI